MGDGMVWLVGWGKGMGRWDSVVGGYGGYGWLVGWLVERDG